MRLALIQMSDSGSVESNIEKSLNAMKEAGDTCRKNQIMAVPNIYLLENERPYDASILINKNGKILGIQKMVHIAQADKFFEQDYYTPSDDGFKVFETEFGKLGIVICFDRHYPESIRTEALKGADLILIPTVNTKAEPSEMFEWELRVQAFQNSTIIAMCNRVGAEVWIFPVNRSLLMRMEMYLQRQMIKNRFYMLISSLKPHLP